MQYDPTAEAVGYVKIHRFDQPTTSVVGKAVTSKKAEYISCQHLSQNAITLHQMPEAPNKMSEAPNKMPEVPNQMSEAPNKMPEILKHKPKQPNQMPNPLTQVPD